MKKILLPFLLLLLWATPGYSQITISWVFANGEIISAQKFNTVLSELATGALNRAGGSATGVILFVPGTAGAPGIAASGDPNTGILFPAADSVGISLGGTQRLLLNASGATVFGVNLIDATGRIQGLSSTYFANLSGANLTNLPASQLSGALPALSGASLTSLDANALASGTLPDARFPTTLPALNGSLLTALNASALASGTVGTARLGSGTANSGSYLRGDGTWAALPSTPVEWTSVLNRPTALSQFTNDSGFQTTGGSVAYATSAGGGWPTTLSSFTNDSGFIPSTVSAGPSYAVSGNITGLNDIKASYHYVTGSSTTTGSYYPMVRDSDASGLLKTKTNGKDLSGEGEFVTLMEKGIVIETTNPYGTKFGQDVLALSHTLTLAQEQISLLQQQVSVLQQAVAALHAQQESR